MRFSTKIQSQITVFDELVKVFNFTRLHRLAKETGFIIRSRKLRACDFVRLCVFWSGKRDFPTLEQMADLLLKRRKRITKQSLNERFNMQAVRFLKRLCTQVLHCKLSSSLDGDWCRSFGRVLIWDSTMGQLAEKCIKKYRGSGGLGSKSAFKLQYCFDLLSGNIKTLKLQSGLLSDGKVKFAGLRRNDLCLFDLGYFKLKNLKKIISYRAYFVCRMHSWPVVFEQSPNGLERLDLLKIISSMIEMEIRELKVTIGAKDKVPVRMIIEKVPAQVSNQKRRKAKETAKRKGRTLGKNALTFCDVNIFITNIEESKLPKGSVRKVYSLRWQVEIVFKCWKSKFGIDKIPNVKTERFECCIWGGLIRVILATRFFWVVKIQAWNRCGLEISELKAFTILADNTTEIEKVILDRKNNPENFIRYLWSTLTKNAPKNRKKGHSLPSQILNNEA